MSWRRTLLTGILAAGLMQAYVPGGLVATAHADKDDSHHGQDRDHDHGHDWDHDHDGWYHQRGYDRDGHRDNSRWSNNDRDHDHHGWYHQRGYDRDGHRDNSRWSNNDRDHDRGYDRDHSRWGSWWGSGNDRDHRGKGDNTKDCWAIRDRIQYDRAQVRKIEPTGRHKKAEQWYKDDIENARNDMRTCRR